MPPRKRPPDLSTLARKTLIAFARKQKAEGAGDDDGKSDAEPRSSDVQVKDTKDVGDTHDVTDARSEIKDGTDAVKDAAVHVPQDELPPIPAPGDPERARADTVAMPAIAIGTPPEVPVSPPAPVSPGDVEEPTFMPGPRDVPSGNPDDPAAAPGRVPAGDSRSLRKRGDRYEFALIYRLGNAVISRFGVVGTRGIWRVVEYPTTGAAGHAYAKECSRFVSEGFSDYRE
ncbi:MAG TPA: hypothetical protein VFQ53_23025 [Kofleriaceae bacterium]|nr:hypothetical protein [Kofleriaceae bacterium]